MSEIIPPNPKTEKKIFKGVEMPITALQNENGIPVHFVEPLKAASQWGHPPKLPRLAVITKITPLAGDPQKRLHVTYRSPKGVNGAAYFPNEYVLRKLTGTVGTSLRKRYEEMLVQDIGRQVYYTGEIGSDPELFVECSKGILPAFEFLGSKKNPTFTSGTAQSYNKKLGAYWDGFQAEFETIGIGCLGWHVDSVQNGLQTVYNAAKSYDKTAKLSARTVWEVPLDMLQNAKEEHVEFGCMPSKNAYGLEGMKLPARQLASRSAGGHIHFGIGARSDEKYKEIVKALDAVLGISCVSLFANFDNPIRRNFYGLPGEYRTPAHGLEYRTLSNAWLMHPMLMNIVFDLSRKCVALGDFGMLKVFKGNEQETIEVIKNCDVPRAREIMDRNKDLIIGLLKACGGGYTENADLVYNVYRNGAESALKDPENIEENWMLAGRWKAHSEGEGRNWWRAAEYLRAGKKV
jgi:hypothetical protein